MRLSQGDNVQPVTGAYQSEEEEKEESKQPSVDAEELQVQIAVLLKEKVELELRLEASDQQFHLVLAKLDEMNETLEAKDLQIETLKFDLIKSQTLEQ